MKVGKTKAETAYRSTILRRVGQGDKSAVKECISEYGNFIWALAKKMTNSREEAEAATEEIFTDIWRHAKNGKKFKIDENAVVEQIVRWRLVRYVQSSAIGKARIGQPFQKEFSTRKRFSAENPVGPIATA